MPRWPWSNLHLPEGRVARQDRRVAPSLDERIERVAHTPAPVLVVADAEDEPRALEHLGVLLEVLRGRDVDAVAVRLRPAREGPLVREPTRPAAPLREAERTRPPTEPHRLPVGLGLHHPPDRLRLDQEAPRERALERHAGAARVQGWPTPVVVRVPGRGRQHEQDRRGLRRVGSHDEERVGAFVAGGHGDGVVARTPTTDGDLEGGRPSASVRRCVVGRFVGSAGDALRAPDRLAFGALADDGSTSKLGASVETNSPTGSPRPTEGGQQYASSVTS